MSEQIGQSGNDKEKENNNHLETPPVKKAGWLQEQAESMTIGSFIELARQHQGVRRASQSESIPRANNAGSTPAEDKPRIVRNRK